MSSRLERRLGLGDAVFIGLGSMIGAGVFAVFQPTAQIAGAGMLVGLVVAAIVAFCNASSSAQLAAQYPSAGGTYVYGREELGPRWGFAAGWSFLIGKIASSAAMAMVFAAYAVPSQWARPVAVAVVVLLVTVNLFGITRTALLTKVIVIPVLALLAVVVASGVLGSGATPATGWSGTADVGGPLAVLQSAGLLFFAFAGYARIATLGEEVRDPSKNIPRAIGIAFAVVVVIYAAIGVTALGALGASGLAATDNPLVDVVTTNGWAWAAPLVRIGAALASLGALLALIAGIGRTAFAMAREGDLPRWFSAVHPRYSTPYRAELVVGAVVVVLVLSADLRGVIGFSSFGVLLYYFVANLAAFRQRAAYRRYPRAVSVLGALGCAVLVVTLPLPAVVTGALVVLAGFALREVRLRGPRLGANRP
ncbi:amino acid/polyamine/organocation transporter, APC superfamily [Agreia bicolorata]|uniref:Amino acid/polyamine/organocation transporter, APC superfamily n=1 Tax=Agreia bicolorata TaxID=110935 RepID=A0A1T4WQR9_9MICO|nr:APC family permease [Agreia bicolorata]SKA79457.1 amino acid/polyamine/organocation transporter, APC superfamily [Agreia bicolorata]